MIRYILPEWILVNLLRDWKLLLYQVGRAELNQDVLYLRKNKPDRSDLRSTEAIETGARSHRPARIGAQPFWIRRASDARGYLPSRRSPMPEE